MSLTDQLATAIEEYPGRANLCGVIRISKGGAVLLERAYGQASVQLGVDNHPGTRFHIASATKMFIAAAVVRLAAKGVLSLQTPPSAYLPALKVLDPRITLHHLLSHQSGLADIYDQPNLKRDVMDLAARGGRLIDHLATLPQAFEPGARWGYSTTGFLLLAYLLEEVGGASFETLIGDMFLRPLGLDDTGPDDPFKVNPGRATGQIGPDGGWRNAPNDRLAEVEGPREFFSTARDLDRWAVGLLDGEVLDEAGLGLMFSRHAQVGPGTGFDPRLAYGYGWFLGPRHRWIGGMTGGFRSAMWQYPQERLNIVMLWNNERVESHGLFAALRPLLRD